MTFLILGLLCLSALALLGAIFFLYRYLMRSHLFPQLPRVWRVEKVRFFLCAGVFAVCFCAFLLTGWLSNQGEDPDESVIYQTQPSQNQPSFDGAPPAPPSNERVLPPRDQADNSGENNQPPEQTTETSSPEPPKPEPAPKPEPPKSETAAKPEAGQPTTPAKPEPSKPAPPVEAPKPQPAKPVVNEPPAKPEPVKPESAPSATESNKPPLPQPKPYVPEPSDLPADMRVTANTPVPSTTPTPTPAAQSSGQFTVCVASYATEAGAQSELKNFQSLGKAQIIAADIPGKGRWYRICINDYATQAQAQAAAVQWRNSGAAKGAFVVRLP